MIRVLSAILLALLLLFVTGVGVFAPMVRMFGIRTEYLVFGIALLMGIVHVISAHRAERDYQRTLTLTLNLENANLRMTQLDKLKSEFLSFASHQIKAPMTVVKGYAQLILDGSFGPAGDELRDVVEKIRRSSDRMIGLVDTFLDLRRIDEGKIQYHMEPLDLIALTSSIVDEMQQLAAAKHLRLSFESPNRPWRVTADAQHLRQVLQNLIDNAIKYTDTGSVTVSIKDGEHPGTVLTQVTDTGRGISRELAPKLFEQFSRDQSLSREIAGTGLGLYIARRIIEAHKGRMWAVSPGPGKGSSFFVEMPTA